MNKRTNQLFYLLVVFLVVTIYPINLFSQDRVNVTYSGNGQTSASLKARFIKDIDFVPVRELADLLEARTYFSALSKKIILFLGNHKVRVTAHNPFIVVDGSNVLQMPINTDFDEQGIWVPLDYFIDLIASYSPTPISYNRNTHTLSLVKEGINILAVNLEEKINGTLIRIPTLRKFNLSNLSVRQSQGWLYIDIYGGRIDSTRLVIKRPAGIVRKMIPIQFEESIQLSFLLRKEVSKENISISSRDDEIQVRIQTSKKIPDNMIVDMEQERKKWMIDKIIIDPGHGGKDPGTIGYRGLKEKDVVLDIAKYLKEKIEKELKIKALLTRNSDRLVELRERSAFANRNGGKLFISIHANSAPARSARGVETLVLGVARNDKDRETAIKENSVIKYEDSWEDYGDLTDENYILMAMAQNSFNKESQQLAAYVQGEVPKALGTKSRDFRQAPYIVLIGTSMPKIILEVGFISNRGEATKLRDKKHKRRVAEGIFKGIKKFKENSEKALIGSLFSNHQN